MEKTSCSGLKGDKLKSCMRKVKKGYIVTTGSRKYTPFDGKIYKTKSLAEKRRSSVTKANSLKQRKMVGFINTKVRPHSLNDREIKEINKSKEYIYN